MERRSMEICAVSGAEITRNALVLLTHAVSRLKGKGKTSNQGRSS